MAKITFKKRTGKDLFEFMERAILDSKLATNWAIEEFTLIDGLPIDLVQITKLNDQAYLMISSKVFPMKDPRISEDNQGIHFEEITIRSKPIHRDFITQLQTQTAKYANNHTGLLKHYITVFFDINIQEAEKMPFQLVAFLISKISFFLESLTDGRDEFELDEIWADDTGNTTDGKLASMV